MLKRIPDILTGALFYIAIPAFLLTMMGGFLYLVYEGQHPERKAYYNQGPLDPTPTH